MSRPPDSTDVDLLAACRAGDRDAFGTFYGRYREPILGYLARRVGNPEVAADLMAETFASALVAVIAPGRALPASPTTWLFAIAKNELIDTVRRGQVAEAARQSLGVGPLVLEDRDIERVIEVAGSGDLFQQLSAHMSRPEWEALRAHVVDDEPYADLAKRLRCSEVVVRKRVSRAKAHLRTVLKGTHA